MKLLAEVLLLLSLGLSGRAEVVVTPEQFGAVGDGKTSDWIPLQKALAFCASAVQSHVLPNGKESGAGLKEKSHQSNAWCRIRFSKSYLSGPLIINSSRTTLDIAEGAKLAMFSKKDYEAACPQTACPFISTSTGEGCRTIYPNPHSPTDGYKVCHSDITVTGKGTIDGASTWDPSSWWLCARLQLKKNCWRPILNFFTNVHRLTINGSLHMKNAPTGFLRLYGNVETRVSGLNLNAPYFSRNTDGINLYGGFDTLLENSTIDNGDDCVSVVPTGEWIDNGNFCFEDPSNILCSGGHAIIRNFTCNGGHGLSVGGIRHGTVINVTFSNITATGGQTGSTQNEAAGGGCRIKSRPNSTGTVSHIRYENMYFDKVYWPLQLLGHYCPFPCTLPDGNTSTLFTNISFESIRGTSSQKSIVPFTETAVAQFKCTKYTPCRNIMMRDVTLTDRDGKKGKLECENVASVSINNASSPNRCTYPSLSDSKPVV